MKNLFTFVCAALFVAVAATSCKNEIPPQTIEDPTFAITITAPVNGTLTVKNGETAIATGDELPAGIEITLAAVPAPGYAFDGWPAAMVAFEGWATTGEGTAKFTMPAAPVTITVNPFKETTVTIGGVKWAKTNLGAPGVFVAQETDFGMYYQFGFNVGWNAEGTTSVPAGATIKGAADYGENGSAVPAWGQGPCPDGFTVPTVADFNALIAACTPQDGPKQITQETKGDVIGTQFVDVEDATKILFFPRAGASQNPMQPAPIENAGSADAYWTAEATPTWTGGFPNASFMTVGTMRAMPCTMLHSVRCVMAPAE